MGYGLLISRNKYNWFEILIRKYIISFDFYEGGWILLQCLVGPFSDTSKDPYGNHKVHEAWREWPYLCQEMQSIHWEMKSNSQSFDDHKDIQ